MALFRRVSQLLMSSLRSSGRCSATAVSMSTSLDLVLPWSSLASLRWASASFANRASRSDESGERRVVAEVGDMGVLCPCLMVVGYTEMVRH